MGTEMTDWIDGPIRVQLRRTKGWRMPPNTVKVDRSTKWGNPWRVGDIGIPDAIEATRRFRAATIGFTSNGSFCAPAAHPRSYIGSIIRDAPRDLRGKNLACWCAPGEPCHADVLLDLANSPTCEEVA